MRGQCELLWLHIRVGGLLSNYNVPSPSSYSGLFIVLTGVGRYRPRIKAPLGECFTTSIRCNNIFACWTLGPHCFRAIIFLVFDKSPRSRDTLIAVRAATKYLRVVGHRKGWKERVTVVLPNERWLVPKISLRWDLSCVNPALRVESRRWVCGD